METPSFPDDAVKIDLPLVLRVSSIGDRSAPGKSSGIFRPKAQPFGVRQRRLVIVSDLSKDLSLILNDSDDYNVIIQVGENENVKEFRAHSVILRARSYYFKSALSTGWITKKNDMIIFNKPNITPTVFDIILK